MFGLKGPQVQDNVKRYDSHFTLELAVKDTRLAQALANEHGVGMSVSNTANRTFIQLSFYCYVVAVLIAFLKNMIRLTFHNITENNFWLLFSLLFHQQSGTKLLKD